MKKSQRLRFIELARRQDDLNDAERTELAALHELACKFSDPSKDIDDLPKKAAPAAPAASKDAVTRKEFEALKESAGEAFREFDSRINRLEKELATLKGALGETPAPAKPPGK